MLRTALSISETVSASTLGTLRRRAAAAATEAGASEETVDAIRLCVGEALANAAMHGYAAQPGVVDVVVELAEDAFVVTVRDYGRGLGAKLERPEVGGLGLGIIRKLSDAYRITSGSDAGTEIAMTFARSRDASATARS